MRRALVVVIGTLVVLGGVAGLALVFSARDEAGVEAPAAIAGPGELEPDRGLEHTADDGGATRSDEPPTSGPHPVRLIPRETPAPDDAAILHAIELGNVVIVHPRRRAPAPLVELREAVAGPFDAELAAAGLMVILAARPGADGIQALAWRRRLRTRDPADPALREFADAYLGKPAPGVRR